MMACVFGSYIAFFTVSQVYSSKKLAQRES